MLPFLKPKKSVGLSILDRSAAPEAPAEEEQNEENQGLIQAATDLMKAIDAKDTQQVAEALRAAFEICELYPHVEGPHTDIEPEQD